METKDIHIGDTVIFKDYRFQEHVKGSIFYIDEDCNDQSAFFIEIPINSKAAYKAAYYNETEVKGHWSDLLPKSILKRLDINKGYTWVDRSQILNVYSELDYLIEDINEELSK